MITAAGLALCASMGVQCHSMDELVATYQKQLPPSVPWMIETTASSPEMLKSWQSDCHATFDFNAHGHLVYLGTEPYEIWACVIEDGSPVS